MVLVCGSLDGRMRKVSVQLALLLMEQSSWLWFLLVSLPLMVISSSKVSAGVQ